MSPGKTGTLASSTLVRSWAIIGSDSSMPVTGTPRSASGTAPPAGPTADPRPRPAVAHLGQPIHRRPQHVGVEHAGAGGVVPLGRPAVPDLILHAPTIVGGARPVHRIRREPTGWRRAGRPGAGCAGRRGSACDRGRAAARTAPCA